MPILHVCPLSKLETTVAEAQATHLVSLLSEGTPLVRPAGIREDRHLSLAMNDIVEPREGCVMPGAEHVERLLAFVRAWDREAPMVIHCWAGVSRSTASAFVAACTLAPERDPREIARALRAASPMATPNRRIVAIADDLLGRNGRMVAAVDEIGRGENCFEGCCFTLALS